MLKKKVFLSIFLIFSFLISNTYANFTIPYSNNTEIKFNQIIGEKIIPSITSIYFTIEGNDYFYINNFDNNFLYKNENIFLNNSNIISYGFINDYLGEKYFIYFESGNFYAKNINDTDINNKGIFISSIIMSNGSYYIGQNSIQDGRYLLYYFAETNITKIVDLYNLTNIQIKDLTTKNPSVSIINNNIIILRNYDSVDNGLFVGNIDGSFNISPLTEIFSEISFVNRSMIVSEDGNFIYIDLINKIYKKENDVWIDFITINNTNNNYSSSINKFIGNNFYYLTNDNIFFKKDLNNPIIDDTIFIDWSNKNAIPNFLIDDGNVYVFEHNMGGEGGLFLKNGGEYIKKLNSFYSWLGFIKDGFSYQYLHSFGGIYKVDLNNPQGYGMNDNIYTSNEISNSNTGVYIQIDTTLPTGTDNEFWLANQNNQEIVLPEGGDVDLMGDRMMSMMGDFSGLGLNVGDSITLYKTGEADIDVVITQISWELRFNNTGKNSTGWGIKKGSANYQKLNNSVLDGNTEINTQTIFGNVTDKLFYKIILSSSDSTKTPVINSVNITATPQTVVTPPGDIPSNSTGGVNLNLGDGTNINIPAEKQITDFIKSLAKQSSINPSGFSDIKNVETFLKENNYDYKNQILIGSGAVPSQTMYNVINLGLNDNSLSNTLSGAINNPNYSKLILTPETYLAGKRIINYLKMDKADEDGNLIISIYNSDTKEYIFLKPKN